MAKVTPLPATPYRPALPLAILAALSVAFGIAIHIQDFHRVPGYWAPQAKLLSGRQLQASLGVDYGYYEPLKLLFVLVGFFEHTLREKTALGVMLVLLSTVIPMSLSQGIESLKLGRSKLVSPLVFISVGLIGQVITIGSATPLIWLPLYALARYRESSQKAHPIHPAPSPPESYLNIMNALSGIVGAIVFSMLYLPNGSPNWVVSCIAFQLFPLVNLPLALLKPSRQELGKNEADGTVKPRLAAADAYKLVSFGTIPFYWAGLYIALPGLRKAWNVGAFSNDGTHLLFYDLVGLLGAQYLLLQIDSYADEARVHNTVERVQHRRFVVEDFFALPGILLLGPGFSIATYYRRREVLAEKARLGVKSE